MEFRLNSITQRLAGVRGSTRKGDRDRPRAKTPGPKRPLPKYLTQAELTRFHKTVRRGGNLRDLVLFGLMYRFGLRVSEAVALQLEDLDLSRQRIRIRRSKGGETKEYQLPRDLVPLLRRYMRLRIDRGPFLFTGRESTNQHGLHVITVQQSFKRYGAAAGLAANIASHSLRHSIAVHSLESNFGLEYVADLLGQTSIRSTAIYAYVVDRGRDDMIRELDKSRHVVGWR
jgi:integrase/recombinase XerC